MSIGGNSDAAGSGHIVSNQSGEPKFPGDGLLPVIVQDYRNGEVLMLAWSDRHAWEETIREGLACFFSRSRQAYWTKGETSGHFLKVIKAQVDCDSDTILYQVIPHGPTCHRNTRSCFVTSGDTHRPFLNGFLTDLEETIHLRLQEDEAQSYVASLARKGLGKMLGKIGEEAAEVAVAATSESEERLRSEAADLLFHLLVLLQYKGVPLHAVAEVLKGRDGVSGLEEKRHRHADS